MRPLDKRDPRTYAIISAAMAVHRELGNGFLEAVYNEALSIEFENQKIPFRKESEIPVYFKGQRLKTFYRADFICFDSVLVEIKAISKLGNIEEAQIINYLKATGLEVGLLLNFGAPSLQFKRFANTQGRKTADFADSTD